MSVWVSSLGGGVCPCSSVVAIDQNLRHTYGTPYGVHSGTLQSAKQPSR